MLIQNFQLMAQYNQWMNQRLYAVVQSLDTGVLHRHLGAYFQSIWGTLNHNVVGDQLWLKRFVNHPNQFCALSVMIELPDIKRLDQILHTTLSDLQAARETLDTVIIKLCDELSGESLEQQLAYQTTDGDRVSRDFGALLQHFFNHQTHHRGQLSTLLFQQGVDIGVTDLLELIPEQPIQH